MHLFSKTYGEGEPVIILHGLFGSLNNWNTLGQQLGQTFKVHLVDQRNHGRSPHDRVHTYKAMAEDLSEYCQEQGLASASLVGHSMGGKTAMEFALTHPGAVRKMVVVDMSPRATAARHDAIMEALTSIRPERFTSREGVDEALKGRIPDQVVRRFLLTNLKREGDGRYVWKMNLAVIQESYGEMNRGIENGRTFNGPVLFLKGGRSPYLSEADLPAIRALFSRAELRTIARAGHWVHAEAPEEFLAAVREFISS
ncbi:MAG: alpha/beta hydrolase [Bacteroidetes bacterium]|nr:alpha/beta hydrolase [Bacteroidota bacterium]